MRLGQVRITRLGHQAEVQRCLQTIAQGLRLPVDARLGAVPGGDDGTAGRNADLVARGEDVVVQIARPGQPDATGLDSEQPALPAEQDGGTRQDHRTLRLHHATPLHSRAGIMLVTPGTIQ